MNGASGAGKRPRARASRGRKQTSPVFRHETALVESKAVGEGTRIWAFVHILPGAEIGCDCNICDHVFVENDVRVGDRVTVKSGVQLSNGVEIEDDVFIGPNATFTNDPFPRSRHRPEMFARTVVKAGASIGANATVLPGLTIGRNAMVGAGAVVTKNVPPHAIVVGNPALITGYVDSFSAAPPSNSEGQSELGVKPTGVRGVEVHDLPIVEDLRGCLTFAEVGKGLPFVPRRYFVVYEVPSREIRGEHAHRALDQFIVCLRGECSIVVDDGSRREEIHLSSPSRGVHLSPMVWGVQYRFSKDAVLLVLASREYDATDYVRDYEEFVSLVDG